MGLDRMKIGVLSPTTWQFMEKMAALFSQGVEVVGPVFDNEDYWKEYYGLKTSEWRELGLRVSFNIASYSDIDFSDYDVLIESVETFHYAKNWINHCHRVECPILLKSCWTRDPITALPLQYVRKVRDFPVLLEMPAHAGFWKSAGFSDVNVIFNPVGDWWFEREWTGAKEQVLFVLFGTKHWRGNPARYGLDVWEKLSRAFPDKTYHHDGYERYKTAKEMTDLFAESRVFVNLDCPYGQGERPLTLAFTEALSAGLPVVARDLPGLSYKDFIDSNGVCTNDFEIMRSFISNCLMDLDFARKCGTRSREIARQEFSCEVLRPKYHELIRRAQEVFERKREQRKSMLQKWPSRYDLPYLLPKFVRRRFLHRRQHGLQLITSLNRCRDPNTRS
jgi:hypothetical protein